MPQPVLVLPPLFQMVKTTRALRALSANSWEQNEPSLLCSLLAPKQNEHYMVRARHGGHKNKPLFAWPIDGPLITHYQGHCLLLACAWEPGQWSLPCENMANHNIHQEGHAPIPFGCQLVTGQTINSATAFPFFFPFKNIECLFYKGTLL